MTRWTTDQLTRIAQHDEIQIAVLRRDGSLRNPVTVWLVRHDNSLYLRSAQGSAAVWFHAALDLRQGRLRAGAIDTDITFVDADPALADAIDAEYRAKYQRYAASILAEVTGRAARAATVKVLPVQHA